MVHSEGEEGTAGQGLGVLVGLLSRAAKQDDTVPL